MLSRHSSTDTRHPAVIEHSLSSIQQRQQRQRSNYDEDENPGTADDDPSFTSINFMTSTPKKTRLQGVGSGETGEAEAEEEEEDLLRVSDTESLDLDGKDGAAFRTTINTASTLSSSRRLKLTRQRLSQLDDASASTNNNNENNNRLHAKATLTKTLSNSREDDGPDQHRVEDHIGHQRDNNRLQLPSRGTAKYAPPPSTGSSTLVERDDDRAYTKTSPRHLKRKQRTTATLEEEHAHELDLDQAHAACSSSSSSSSSEATSRPRMRINKRAGQLSTYLDSKTDGIASTPPLNPRVRADLRSSAPATPQAPGAFPKSTRRLATSSLRYSPPESVMARSTPLPSSSANRPIPSGSKQVQDAFKRYITGPNGAITLSAERRALVGTVSSAHRSPPPASVPEPPTPHPVGFYAFSPSTSLPVESLRDQRRHKEPLPPSAKRPSRQQEDHREAAWPDKEEDGISSDPPEDSDNSLATSERRRFEASPTARPRTSSKLEKALRHIGRHQRETEARTEDLADEADDHEPAEREDRSESEDVDSSAEGNLVGLANRSAIEFAMAKSVIHDNHDPARTLAPWRDVKTSTPPRQRERQRSPSPLSPQLPELPPVRSEESSPARSPATDQRSPPRREVRISQTAQRESFQSPVHSTPPRRSFQPPAPMGTPAASSPQQNVPRQQASTSDSRSQNQLFGSPSPKRRAPDHKQSRLDAQAVTSEGDTSLAQIVAELASAVRSLGEPNQEEDERHGRTSSLTSVLSRRKLDSDSRRRQLENELEGLEREAVSGQVARDQVFSQLYETEETEITLAEKVDQLRQSFEALGSAVGTQVVAVVQETLHDEAKRRTSWVMLVLSVQFVFFWLLIRIANARNSHMHDMYYDPFQSSLFFVASSPYSEPTTLLPQTLELFSQQLPRAPPILPTAIVTLKNWVDAAYRDVSNWAVQVDKASRTVPL